MLQKPILNGLEENSNKKIYQIDLTIGGLQRIPQPHWHTIQTQYIDTQ